VAGNRDQLWAFRTEVLRHPGLAQTAAGCSLRSRRDLYFEIIEITRNADSEPRVCASPRSRFVHRFLTPLPPTFSHTFSRVYPGVQQFTLPSNGLTTAVSGGIGPQYLWSASPASLEVGVLPVGSFAPKL